MAVVKARRAFHRMKGEFTEMRKENLEKTSLQFYSRTDKKQYFSIVLFERKEVFFSVVV